MKQIPEYIDYNKIFKQTPFDVSLRLEIEIKE